MFIKPNTDAARMVSVHEREKETETERAGTNGKGTRKLLISQTH